MADWITQSIIVALVSGSIVGIASFVAIRWSTNKGLKAAEERLRIQLLYDDKKKALGKINSFLNDPHPGFIRSIRSFLETSEAEFLPGEFEREFRKKVSEIEEYAEDEGLKEQPYSDAELRWLEQQSEEAYESLPNWDKVKEEYEQRVNELKSSIKQLIRKHMKP